MPKRQVWTSKSWVTAFADAFVRSQTPAVNAPPNAAAYIIVWRCTAPKTHQQTDPTTAITTPYSRATTAEISATTKGGANKWTPFGSLAEVTRLGITSIATAMMAPLRTPHASPSAEAGKVALGF